MGLAHSVNTSSVAQQVVRQITSAIRDGVYAPGMRLPSERTMAHDLEVGRKTITTAYERLEDLGLLRRFRGKGAFVCQPMDPGAAFSWSGKISSHAHVLDEPILELLSRTSIGHIQCPLSVGTPSLDCFPYEEFQAAMHRLLQGGIRPALAVAPTEGQPKLRRAISDLMGVEMQRVMVTLGAQEGVDLIARCLIEHGEYAIVESPTYPGAIQSLRAAGARLAEWDTDWSLHRLESLLLTHKPKLIFTTPTFHNPTGRTMPLATRLGLLELAAKYRVPIVEDDVYSRAVLGEIVPPQSLLALDRQNIVAYVSTFSKILAPGLRVGWVAAPTYLIKQLSLMKMRANLFTEGIQQLVIADLIESGKLQEHLGNLRRHHTTLRDVLVQSLEEASRSSVLRFEVPQGGLYLWCQVQDHTELDMALDWAEREGVSVAPGQAFYSNGGGQRHFRLCFAAASREQLQRGAALLIRALRKAS